MLDVARPSSHSGVPPHRIAVDAPFTPTYPADDGTPEMDDLEHAVVDASDHSLLVRVGGGISVEAHRRVRGVFEALRRSPLPGVANLHPAYASVLISYDPVAVGRDDLRARVAERVRAADDLEIGVPSVHEIPVVYGGECGPDLAVVAAHCGLPADEVARRHAAGAYYVAFLGFSPGFPYLGGLPPEIAAPRRAAPRTRVEVGSVAIGGSQAGVYPLASPGGWQVIGRTPLSLFDPRRRPPALLELGDRVRFVAVPEAAFAADAGAAGAAPPVSGGIRVLAAGFQTTVQDLGRPWHAHLGVSASGAADAFSLRAGNLLVGNPEGAAALEMTLVGAALRFEEAATIAVTGSDFSPQLDGRPIPPWTAVGVRPGQTLAIGATCGGARCIVCVSGGIEVVPVLGSASTHLTSGLGGIGGRGARKGDVLPIGVHAASPMARAADLEAVARIMNRSTIRVTRGAQWDMFTEEARRALFSSVFGVREESSRMGLRLEGEPLAAERPGEMLTEGVSLGALQVPGDGRPIVSFVEHQTTGGYPQIACVIAADLHRVGQLRARDRVRFEEVSLDEAGAALRELERELPALGVGR